MVMLRQPTNTSTPLRRSTRHQPQVGSAGVNKSANWTHRWLGGPWLTRPTKPEDLHQGENEIFQKAEGDGDEGQERVLMETAFYEAFTRTRVAKYPIGKGKRPEIIPEPELFKVGDTILIYSDKKRAPNVGVIVALWDTHITHGEPENTAKFESMKLRVHWFVRPEQRAQVSARRKHSKNEIYFSLRENATLAPADVVGHCDVSSQRPSLENNQAGSNRSPTKSKHQKLEDIVSDTHSEDCTSEVFFCGLALDARKGLYYEFNWEYHRKIAMRDGLRECETLWDLDVNQRPKKRKDGASRDDGSSDDVSDEYIQNGDEEQDSDAHTDVVTTDDEELSCMDDLHDGDHTLVSTSKKRKRSQKDESSKTVTPRKRRRLAVPTPLSKAALQERRKSRKKLFGRHVIARVPPHVASGHAQLRDLPLDPFLRAMHVLHPGVRPDALPCRDNEYMEIMSAILGLVEEGSGGCVYISGVPGTGKTATVHSVVRELKSMAKRSEINPFTYVEINGLKIPEPSAAYALLWEGVSGHDSVADGYLGISAKEALKRLSRHFSAGVRAGPGGHVCVVLMDELDQLVTPKQDVIYNFFNWPSLKGSKLIVIAVANTHDLPERVMSGRVRSRLGMLRINFHPYDRPQLQKIVHARLESAKEGLSTEAAVDVFEPDAVKFVAMKVSGVSGDARRILDVCRRAVELIRSTQAKLVQISHVQQVLTAMQNSPTAAYIRDCSLHERIMLAALLKCIKREGVDEIRWGDVQFQHRLYMNSLTGEEAPRREPNEVELSLVLDSLVAAGALLIEEGATASRKHWGDRKVVLNIEPGEVERVLSDMGGSAWKNALGL